jgi:hypothetical protein
VTKAVTLGLFLTEGYMIVARAGAFVREGDRVVPLATEGPVASDRRE